MGKGGCSAQATATHASHRVASHRSCRVHCARPRRNELAGQVNTGSTRRATLRSPHTPCGPASHLCEQAGILGRRPFVAPEPVRKASLIAQVDSRLSTSLCIRDVWRRERGIGRVAACRNDFASSRQSAASYSWQRGSSSEFFLIYVEFWSFFHVGFTAYVAGGGSGAGQAVLLACVV